MTKWKQVMQLCKEGKRGDALELILKPIAVALNLDCIDKETGKLKPESGCAHRRNRLNESGKPDQK